MHRACKFLSGTPGADQPLLLRKSRLEQPDQYTNDKTARLASRIYKKNETRMSKETLWTEENVQRVYIAAFFFVISIVWKAAICLSKRGDEASSAAPDEKEQVTESAATRVQKKSSAPTPPGEKWGTKKGSASTKDKQSKAIESKTVETIELKKKK